MRADKSYYDAAKASRQVETEPDSKEGRRLVYRTRSSNIDERELQLVMLREYIIHRSQLGQQERNQ